jgi:hypothetical protein
MLASLLKALNRAGRNGVSVEAYLCFKESTFKGNDHLIRSVSRTLPFTQIDRHARVHPPAMGGEKFSCIRRHSHILPFPPGPVNPPLLKKVALL